MRPIEDIGRISIPTKQAEALARAAHAIAFPEDPALRARDVQLELRSALRSRAPIAFDELEGAIAERLRTPPHFSLASGLPPSDGTPILVAFSAGLGELIEPYQQTWSRVVRHILPSRDRIIDGRVLNEFLHTDGTDWHQPNDFTCLFCVRPDQKGEGRSRLLDVESLMIEVEARDPSLVPIMLREPLPWRLADELGGGFFWAPALLRDPWRIRWLRYTITLSQKDDPNVLPPEMVEVVERFWSLIETSARIFDFAFAPGNMLFVDNARCMHSRTAITAPETSERHLLRTKIGRTVTF